VAALVELKREGKIRFIGMSGVLSGPDVWGTQFS
jgi:aryl-alcohol dehydrogenase-like predicted oxidoreductase